jgi:UDP-glucose 4-epimerase
LIKNKKILIIGSSGFLGKHLVKALSLKNNVTQFDINPPDNDLKNIKYFNGSILDKTLIEKAVNNVDIVYHFAAMTDIDIVNNKPAQAIEINIAGTTNILECCAKKQVERLIFSSSVYVYSNYGGVYKSTKQACELLIEDYNKMYGLNYSILQLGSVYGPGAIFTNLISRFIYEAITNGEIKHFGTGEEIRQYIYVKDVVDQAIKLIDEKYTNKKIILIGNESITINQLINEIISLLNLNIKKTYEINDYKIHYKTSPFDLNTKNAIRLEFNNFTKLKLGLDETIYSIKKNIN